jgi:hypothetical protein
MPIRFRCPYCDQLLGIARRKSGAVVDCPRCRGRVGVPADAPSSPGLTLSRGQATILFLGAGLLALLAFAAGLLVGALT